jgi:PPK2 family polyphosphate:nucleotide phosphotransferase
MSGGDRGHRRRIDPDRPDPEHPDADDIDPDDFRIRRGERVDLAERRTDEDLGLDKHHGKQLTAELHERLAELQSKLYAQRTHRVLVVAQAMDTGGKDGLIKKLLLPVNPQGVRVESFAAPSAVELAHDYLWRVHARVPADGELVIFNRSHYEDVLVVRVHGLVAEERWRRRFDHIRHFEQMLADEGTTIVKVFLHISRDEQRDRLQARLDDPTKHWKFDLADLDERKRWDDYQQAYADAISETSTDDAPWYVIPADHKWFRDLIVARIVVHTLDGLGLAYPESEDLSGVMVE